MVITEIFNNWTTSPSFLQADSVSLVENEGG